MQLTPAHEHILLHALGVDRREGFVKEPWRNRFYPGGDDVRLCMELESAGFMRETKYPDGSVYHVTEAGIAEAQRIAPPVRHSRGRRRYRAWLKVADAFPDWSFGDWLKEGYGKSVR